MAFGRLLLLDDHNPPDDQALSYLYGHFSPSRVAVMGDSAGGGLAFATCIEAYMLGLPRPACLVALSPWTDLTISNESIHSNAGTDQLFSPYIAPFNTACLGCYRPCMEPANRIQGEILHHQFKNCARSYAGNEIRNPTASPLLASLEVLREAVPPTHVCVSDSEVLRDDGVRMQKKLREAGVYATLERYKNEVHVFPVFNSKEGTTGGAALSVCVKHISDCIQKKIHKVDQDDRVVDHSIFSLRGLSRHVSSVSKQSWRET